MFFDLVGELFSATESSAEILAASAFSADLVGEGRDESEAGAEPWPAAIAVTIAKPRIAALGPSLLIRLCFQEPAPCHGLSSSRSHSVFLSD